MEAVISRKASVSTSSAAASSCSSAGWCGTLAKNPFTDTEQETCLPPPWEFVVVEEGAYFLGTRAEAVLVRELVVEFASETRLQQVYILSLHRDGSAIDLDADAAWLRRNDRFAHDSVAAIELHALKPG